MTANQQIPTRSYAHPLDIPLERESEPRGHDPSPDAIGGYYGIRWEEFFQDRNSGQVYKVSCTDGVNGGKGAYLPRDEAWRLKCFDTIQKNCRDEIKAGSEEIRISRNERVVMQGFIHRFWLESAEGKGDGKQSDQGLEGGLVGYCLGVPVICDLEMADRLPPRE